MRLLQKKGLLKHDLIMLLVTPLAEEETCQEMKAYIGMVIMMGILQLPHLDMYWQVDDEILGNPGISQLISQIRFQQISRFLHLADNSQPHPASCKA